MSNRETVTVFLSKEECLPCVGRASGKLKDGNVVIQCLPREKPRRASCDNCRIKESIIADSALDPRETKVPLGAWIRAKIRISVQTNIGNFEI